MRRAEPVTPELTAPVTVTYKTLANWLRLEGAAAVAVAELPEGGPTRETLVVILKAAGWYGWDE